MAVQRVVGGVEVENDLLGRPCMRREEEVDEQGLDRCRVMADFVVARGERTGKFEPIERRLASQRRAIRAPTLELARQRRHQRVVAKLVMVVDVYKFLLDLTDGVGWPFEVMARLIARPR